MRVTANTQRAPTYRLRALFQGHLSYVFEHLNFTTLEGGPDCHSISRIQNLRQKEIPRLSKATELVLGGAGI